MAVLLSVMTWSNLRRYVLYRLMRMSMRAVLRASGEAARMPSFSCLMASSVRLMARPF